MKRIPYGKQHIDSRDKNFVLNSLSNNLITTGPIVEKFENKLEKYLNCKFAYTCNSGTSALHLAMLSINLKKNDVVLMPAVNFIASYNIAKNMQLKVYLVDVDEYTGQITPDTVNECIKRNKLKKIKALVVMYHGGFPENVKNFYDLKKKFNFKIIEDACHALGSEYEYKNKFYKIGSCKHADISTFSFHPLKTITSGEGGLITTNSGKIAKNIKLYRSHGIIRNNKNYWKYDVIKNGFNYRLSDINCALGLSQLSKISSFLKNRRKIYNKYYVDLGKLNLRLILPKYSQKIKPSFHLCLLNIAFKKIKKNKNHFMKYLIKHNIFAQQHYIPIYKFKIFKETKNYFSGSENFYNNSVSIPIYVSLSISDQNRIINVLKNYFKMDR